MSSKPAAVAAIKANPSLVSAGVRGVLSRRTEELEAIQSLLEDMVLQVALAHVAEERAEQRAAEEAKMAAEEAARQSAEEAKRAQRRKYALPY